MSSSAMGAGERQDVVTALRCELVSDSGIVRQGPVMPIKGRADYSSVILGDAHRTSLMIAPRGRGSFTAQAEEVFANEIAILKQQPFSMRVTSQTIFLQRAEDQAECERLLRAMFGDDFPTTNFVYQAPCCGAGLAVEAWAVRADTVGLRRIGRHAVLLNYDDLEWLHCGGIRPNHPELPVYEQTIEVLENTRKVLGEAGFDFTQVVRTWFFLGGITEVDNGMERYKELNRARTDFYQGIGFFGSKLKPGAPLGAYPASTGIGMNGTGLVVGCTAFRSAEKNCFILPLENPRQVPAYAYHPKYSPQSPKFSRALALLRPNYAITWISGTASIVNSESRHLGDIEKQTHQTLDNIEHLIAAENFACRGVADVGATFRDLAKVRVYIKRHEDYAKCKAVCEKRFGTVPAIYAVADVCRSELLVEIEGIAFSPRKQPVSLQSNGKQN